MSMTATAPATWNHERFESNVAALERVQPELARRLTDLNLPRTIEPAHGRDGTLTFRIPGPDRRRGWLGRTSMPSISAPAAIEHFKLDGANVLIPLVGTGVEADLLCKRLARHMAVFAYDADPVNVKLALYVSDLAEHFRDGRLVLLTFDPIGDALQRFLSEHPGYDFPHRLLVHPAVSPQALDQLRTASEAAAATLIEWRLRTAQQVAAELGERPKPVVGQRPRVVVLSSDPRPGALATVERLAGALAELDWPAAVHAPSSPDRCHNLARLIQIRDHRPDLVLFFNSCAGRLTDFIPPDQPVASWFWSDSAVGPALQEGYGSGHHMFAATPGLCGQLREGGVSPERVHLLEAGVDTSIYKPVAIDPQRRKLLTCAVAILADAADESAAAVGIKHSRPLALWKKIRALTARRAHEYTSSTAAQIVMEAERAIGVKMTSEEVREKFAQAIRQRLAGTAIVRATVIGLRRAGVSVKVWGSGWKESAELRDLVAGPIPDAPSCNEIYQCASAVVFPVFDASAAQAILEVTAAGGQAIFRTSEVELSTLHPQTVEVFELLGQYGDLKALLSRVREAGVTNGQQVSNAATPRQCVTTEHSLIRRWTTIRDTLSGRV